MPIVKSLSAYWECLEELKKSESLGICGELLKEKKKTNDRMGQYNCACG